MSKASQTALFLHGLNAGALLFVSVVTARTLPRLSSESLRSFFPVWWPAGRDLMVPLGAAVTVAHTAAAVADPQHLYCHAVSAAGMVAVIGWTGGVMMKDISALRKDDDGDTEGFVKAFVWKHHVRTVVSLATWAWVAAVSGGGK